MKYAITYRNNNDGCAYTSNEVFVDDSWTESQIIEWYEKRHSNIHCAGIKVISICPFKY